MSRAMALGAWVMLAALPAVAQDSVVVVDAPPLQSPRSGGVQFRLGGYKPRIDTEKALKGKTPYKDIFGDDSLLLFEAELQRYFYQGIGTAGVGLSAGYGEKYAESLMADGSGKSPEKTAIKVIPIQASLFYKFDYPAFEWGVPFVPYGKLGLVYSPWWFTKGPETETANGNKGSGAKWGWAATAGLSFMLDILEPSFARSFDSDLGVNHTYLFGEYTYADVNNFGGKGLVLSSRRWMFGLAFDY